MKDIGIFGTSGHAREVADVACDLGYHVIHVARSNEELDAWRFPGDVMLESELRPGLAFPFVIGIGDNAIRRILAERFAGILHFGNLVHPSATFGQGQRGVVDAGRGIVVCAGVRFTNNVQVGNFTLFNLNASIGHDAIIGDFVNLAPGACISGNVHLQPGCLIGAGAVVNQGTPASPLIIGSDTTIGSGCVVIEDCEPHAVYVGVPAKRIK
jgi:sugar O-acyltransferase (sialic acid O-acetyltransferase NeuD family)